MIVNIFISIMNFHFVKLLLEIFFYMNHSRGFICMFLNFCFFPPIKWLILDIFNCLSETFRLFLVGYWTYLQMAKNTPIWYGSWYKSDRWTHFYSAESRYLWNTLKWHWIASLRFGLWLVMCGSLEGTHLPMRLLTCIGICSIEFIA